MARLALIISSDKALATFVGESLAQYGYDYEIAAEKLQVPAQLRRISPELVVCDRDMQGINSLLLCKTLKETAPIGFALMVARNSSEKIQGEARSVGVDQLLSKPLNRKHLDDFVRGHIAPGQHGLQELKDQLEAFVKGFITSRMRSSENDTLFLILLNDTLTRCVMVRLLSIMGARTINCDTVYEAMVYLDNAENMILLTSPDNLAEAVALGPESLKNIVLLTVDNSPIPENISGSNARLHIDQISYPAPVGSIAQGLIRSAPKLRLEERTPPTLDFSSNEMSLLAARISAAVFEKLLVSQPLQHGNWQESAKLVRNEVLTTCRELEEVMLRRHAREKS